MPGSCAFRPRGVVWLIWLALTLWLLHGVLLWRGWGRFRPQVALLHGVGVALAGVCFALSPFPLWLPFGAGALLGLVGALGHPLVPGLWVGLGLLGAVAAGIPGNGVHQAAAAFSLAAQVCGLVMLLRRRSHART